MSRPYEVIDAIEAARRRELTPEEAGRGSVAGHNGSPLHLPRIAAASCLQRKWKIVEIDDTYPLGDTNIFEHSQ
jgi:hypothetical protein